jgi:hypothetical protein
MPIPFSGHIDGYGKGRDRRAVRLIQKVSGREERLAAAQAKRERKAAKRAQGTNIIVFYDRPIDGVTTGTPAGCYVKEALSGQWQLIVVGKLKAPVDKYREAFAAWRGAPYRITSEHPIGDTAAGPALSLILEPGVA